MEMYIEGKRLLITCSKSYNLYFKNGSRSPLKVNEFHEYIKQEITCVIKNCKSKIYDVKLEQNINSVNATNKKKCDIVVYKNNVPYIVFPVKMIMSNYKQNKNNGWENLTGELSHLIWANNNLIIIPINIFMNKVPYLNKNQEVVKYETILYSDICNYELLKEKQLAYEILNYIIDVNQTNPINEKYTIQPDIIGFNIKTKYKSFKTMLKNLIN